jgi:hypothetical protein
MPFARVLPGLFTITAITVMTACASAPPADAGGTQADDPPAAGQFAITINNDHTSWTEVTVFIMSESSVTQTVLGTVPPGERRQFTYGGERGWYRLMARRVTGDANSERFLLPAGARVEWRTSQTRVQVNTR